MVTPTFHISFEFPAKNNDQRMHSHHNPASSPIPRGPVNHPHLAAISQQYPGAADWGWKPEYDVDAFFDHYFLPEIRKRYGK